MRKTLRAIMDAVNWPLVIFIAFAIGVRLMYSNDTDIRIDGDSGIYDSIAIQFAHGGLMGPGASRPPFMPLMLALISSLLHLQISDQSTFTLINCICDAISIALLFKIVRRVAPSVPPFGALFVSISPLWFADVNAAVTESTSIVLFLAFLERWTREPRLRRDLLASGIYLGLLSLTRGMYAVFPIALVVSEWLQKKAPKGARLEGLKPNLIFLASSYALPIAWGIRNVFRVGQFIMTQDDSLAVLMAWSSIKRPLLDWRLPDDVRFMSEQPWADVLGGYATPDRTVVGYAAMRAEVLDYVHQHPFVFLWNFFPKLERLWVTGWWSPFSYVSSPPYLESVYIGGCCLPILVLGAIGWSTQFFSKGFGHDLSAAQWRATRVQILLVALISSIALPFTVDARFSLPAYVTFGLWVGLGWAWIARPRGIKEKPLSPRPRSARKKAVIR